MVLTSGYFVTSLPESFLIIGRGEIMGIPFPVIASLIIVITFDFLLKNWVHLNRAFHVGANPDNAELLTFYVGQAVKADQIQRCLTRLAEGLTKRPLIHQSGHGIVP